jgi:hypothetical protein
MVITGRSYGKFWLAGILVVVLLIPSICALALAAVEKAVTAEKNPHGDPRLHQVFVTYSSPLGFALQVAGGWSRGTGRMTSEYSTNTASST